MDDGSVWSPGLLVLIRTFRAAIRVVSQLHGEKIHFKIVIPSSRSIKKTKIHLIFTNSSTLLPSGIDKAGVGKRVYDCVPSDITGIDKAGVDAEAGD